MCQNEPPPYNPKGHIQLCALQVMYKCPYNVSSSGNYLRIYKTFPHNVPSLGHFLRIYKDPINLPFFKIIPPALKKCKMRAWLKRKVISSLYIVVFEIIIMTAYSIYSVYFDSFKLPLSCLIIIITFTIIIYTRP